MKLNNLKQALKDTIDKSKELDEINKWFLSLNIDKKKGIFNSYNKKGICSICGKKVAANFYYCKEHYPKKDKKWKQI